MRVFVTGASGWIGSAVVAELLANGHEALGLARSDAAAEAIAAAGAEVVRGEITDLDVLRDAAAESDAVVHLAFRHDVAFSGDFDTAVESNQAAIEAIGETLVGSDRPFAIASGLAGLRAGVIATEDDRPEPTPGAGGRVRNELTALAFADRGVRSMSVRFAPTVHGTGDHGFIALIFAADREHGVAAYVGDGQNRWPAVHVSDAARLVRLGVERAPAGTVLHAAGEEGVPFVEIAEAIGRRLQLPATSIPADQADQQFGFLGRFVAMGMPASSARTRQLLDWEPTGPGLIADIDAGAYDPVPVA
ncbi:MAG TPA: SDR family oxidoreductase [Solirubrobacteraceae bacterium]|nr:SDR family oxidoreductase [Solirubrobacteraceae bacterium]